MAESIPCDKINNKERENPGEKMPNKDSAVPQREKKKVPQKAALHDRSKFYNRDYYRYDLDFRSSKEGERVTGFRHPSHRSYWHSRDDTDQWFNGDSEIPRQYYHSKSARSSDPQYHRRGGKRHGYKSADSKQALSQDVFKERKKRSTVQESASSIADKNGEKIINEKTLKAEVATEATRAEDQLDRASNETVSNLFMGESGEKVKRKPDVSEAKTEDRLAEPNNQNTDLPVADKSIEKKVFKKKPDVDKAEKTKMKTPVEQTANNLVTDKRAVKKKHANKDLTKTSQSTTVKTGDQTNSPKQVKKEEKQNRPTADNDKVTDKDMVIMVGKYQVKKFKPISIPNVALTDENNTGGAPNSKVTSDRIANQTASTHPHKRRVYHNKAIKGSSRHSRGIVASLQSDVLSQQLSTGQYECMVCCDRVRVKDPVWSCSTCYHIFHLKCIKKWAKIPTNIEEG